MTRTPAGIVVGDAFAEYLRDLRATWQPHWATDYGSLGRNPGPVYY